MTAPYLFSALDAGGYAVLRILLSILWQSTILLAAAGALAWILRKRGDAVRHAVWTRRYWLCPSYRYSPWERRGSAPLVMR